MAFLLKVRSLLSVLLAVVSLVAMQKAAQAEPVLTSYYGNELAGNPTASGEPFDPYGLTAAHPYLPFGTVLTATYEGRSVTVRVNDRGPFVPGRGLDLSLGAAQAIGLTESGPAVVEVEAGGAPEAKPQAAQSETTEPAEPSDTSSSAETVPSSGELETGEHRSPPSTSASIPPGKRVADSMDEESSPRLEVDVPLATRLAEEREQRVDPTVYVRPTLRGRRSGRLSEGVG
jgi:rare lipoprotein A